MEKDIDEILGVRRRPVSVQGFVVLFVEGFAVIVSILNYVLGVRVGGRLSSFRGTHIGRLDRVL